MQLQPLRPLFRLTEVPPSAGLPVLTFDDFALDFPWHVNEDFHDADALAKAVIAYAEQLGLLVRGANAEIVELDG